MWLCWTLAPLFSSSLTMSRVRHAGDRHLLILPNRVNCSPCFYFWATSGRKDVLLSSYWLQKGKFGPKTFQFVIWWLSQLNIIPGPSYIPPWIRSKRGTVFVITFVLSSYFQIKYHSVVTGNFRHVWGFIFFDHRSRVVISQTHSILCNSIVTTFPIAICIEFAAC